MTDKELSELEAAARAATPGPWITVKDDFDEDKNLITTEQRYEASPQIVEIAILETGWNEPMESEQQANLAYIAAANPAVVLKLIAELRQTRKERDWLVQTLEDEQYCYPAPMMEGGRLICEEQVIECDKCDRYSKEHWLKAAKEATCLKN